MNTIDIVPDQPRIMTAESSEEIHNIQFMHVGSDDNLTSHPNESLKNADSTVSLQVQQSPFGRCIGRKFLNQSSPNLILYVIDNYLLSI